MEPELWTRSGEADAEGVLEFWSGRIEDAQIPVRRAPFDALCDTCGQREQANVHRGYTERTISERAGESGTLGTFMPPHPFVRGEWVRLRVALKVDGDAS